jgi:(1->4)-alpha-D-glucan 1-alpha-D-glucosylmutase
LIRELCEHWPDGRVKLYVTAEGLAVRRELPETFLKGAYVPLDVRQPAGHRSPEVVAFARQSGDRVVIVAAPRFCGALAMAGRWPIGHDIWGDAAIVLPPTVTASQFTDRLTGESTTSVDGRLRVGELLQHFPVSISVAG